MIALDESNIWEKLSSPYGNSNEIPSLIQQLSQTFEKKIADEILWEYIYHQGSVYENTLTTVPHLVNLIESSSNLQFNLDIIASLGIVLMEFEDESAIEQTFEENSLDEINRDRIRLTFIEAIEKFKTLVHQYAGHLDVLDEETKRFYLIAYFVATGKFKEAEVFKTFSINDEYIFVCPHCEEETFLWNEENILNAYPTDPVTNKNQAKLKIEPNDKHVGLTWLEEPIEKMNIASLKPLIPYFKGNLICHSCSKKYNVFEGIMNSI